MTESYWFCTDCGVAEAVEDGRMKLCWNCGRYMVLRPIDELPKEKQRHARRHDRE